jgi:1,4-alpha-glucan branching enzyme
MPATQQNITSRTPPGANLVDGGCTFKVWAPRARQVYFRDDFTTTALQDSKLLVPDEHGNWTGFIPGVKDGDLYNFRVLGRGRTGDKRDPYARELTNEWPNPKCIVRSATSYPWQDGGWRTPDFSDLIVYQLHVGTWYGPNRANRVAKILDILDRVEYLASLGVNAIEPLPLVEYSSPRSMGYNGSDLFSPEMDYQVYGAELDQYVSLANRLLAAKNKQPVTRKILTSGVNQMKCVVDICHAYGIAVILDVVFNHASGDVKGQPESIWFFDLEPGNDPNDSLYFTDQDHTGPVFNYGSNGVRQFLIDNAKFFLDEYHVDGFRYDQVTVIDQQSYGKGWSFCQDLTSTLVFLEPSAINIAEYWGPEPQVVKPKEEGGAGFHANWHNGLRIAVRGLIAQASAGQGSFLDWQPVVDQLRAPGFPNAWRAVQYVESHDEVYRDRGMRIPKLAVGGTDTRTWHAVSRARVAAGLILTAPGIPMLFMGQEFYEDKQWADDTRFHAGLLINWDGLQSDHTMQEFLRFTTDLVWLRRKHPALRGEGVATRLMENGPRVLVFQRWVEGVGRDAVVVASLNESTHYGYQIPMAWPGEWFEVFNSDAYQNPTPAGNAGSIHANGPGMNGLPYSAFITVPANSVLVFTRDRGD